MSKLRNVQLGLAEEGSEFDDLYQDIIDTRGNLPFGIVSNWHKKIIKPQQKGRIAVTEIRSNTSWHLKVVLTFVLGVWTFMRF